eukprot:12488098-Ditylum_brightwellii.AAC.1
MAADMIKVDPTGFTGICWRRSGATTMANQGESAISLKHAGGWKSNKVVQGYIAQCKHRRANSWSPSFPIEAESGEEGDGAASEGDDSCKLVEWAVCGTVVINNYYVSPSKKEEQLGRHM